MVLQLELLVGIFLRRYKIGERSFMHADNTMGGAQFTCRGSGVVKVVSSLKPN